MTQLEDHQAAAARFRRQIAGDSATMQKRQNVSKTFATEIISVDDAGNMELRFNVEPAYANLFGTLHGGILSALIDEACSCATVAAVGIHCFLGTTEVQTRIFAKAKPGLIEAKASIAHLSRYAAYSDCELYSGERKVAAGSAIILIDASRPINEKWVVDA